MVTPSSTEPRSRDEPSPPSPKASRSRGNGPSQHPASPTPLPAIAPTLGAQRTIDGIVIQWTANNGTRYRLESVDALGSPWSTITRISGNGTPVDVLDPSPTSDTRFYRVVVE